MKKYLKVLLLCLLVPCVFMIAGCGKNDDAEKMMTVSINPEITFTLNSKDKVVGVLYGNEDAEVLYANVEFEGMTCESALQVMVDYATISGHLNLSGDDIEISLVGDVNLESIKNKVDDKIKNISQKMGVPLNTNFNVEKVENQKEVLSYLLQSVKPYLTNAELEAMELQDVVKEFGNELRDLGRITNEQFNSIYGTLGELYNSVLQNAKLVFEQAETALKNAENALKDIPNELKAPLEEALKTAKTAYNDAKVKFEQKIEEFEDKKEELIEKAQKQFEQLKKQFKTELQTQIDTAKQNVMNHFETAKNNGTITQEQYDYIQKLYEQYK